MNDYDLVDETIITAGQMCIIPPEEYHSFRAEEKTIAFEIYWVELGENDIIRESVGGKK